MNIQDEELWITDFIQVQLDEEIVKRIKNFTLLWNLYETFGCGRNANLTSISNNINDIENTDPIVFLSLQRFREYFKHRYFNADDTPTPRFARLEFTPNIEAVVTNALIHGALSTDTLKAMMYIVYRYRNNLFHGNKVVAHLNGQLDNFTHANELLTIVLDMMKVRNMII